MDNRPCGAAGSSIPYKGTDSSPSAQGPRTYINPPPSHVGRTATRLITLPTFDTDAMTETDDSATSLFDLYRSLDMELAMTLEQEFSDSELGLVAQSTTTVDYPID